MNLSMCLSRLSLSLPPPHFCSNGGRIFRRPFPAPMALHLEKIGSHSNSFAGSSLSLTVFAAKKKKYKMKTHKQAHPHTHREQTDRLAEGMEKPPLWSGPKTHLKSETLYQYILDTTVYPREPDCLKELRNITANVPRTHMAVPPDEALFLSMLLKLMNAKNTMEIGVYTGYSLLNAALAIPDDGKILAIDINRETYKVGLPVIEKARVAHKIEFREGPALTILEQLLTEEKYRGLFDFVFVDADKTNNLNYHKRVMELVRVGGVIAYDNSLYGGFVEAPPDKPLFRGDTDSRDVIVELNKVLAADPQIEVCQLPIANGLTLCRRLY